VGGGGWGDEVWLGGRAGYVFTGTYDFAEGVAE
jgi:hypothetical protein